MARYTTRPRHVEAYQWDGSEKAMEEIRAALRRLPGEWSAARAGFQLRIYTCGHLDDELAPRDWLVIDGTRPKWTTNMGMHHEYQPAEGES